MAYKVNAYTYQMVLWRDAADWCKIKAVPYPPLPVDIKSLRQHMKAHCSMYLHSKKRGWIPYKSR